MADTHEIIADIIAEMRRRIAVKMGDAWYTQEEWRKLCDRLEAAIKRERAKIEVDALAVGGIVGATPNAAAMHSCLLKILAEMIDLGGMERGRKACFSPDSIAEEIRQALAAPPRNCDVGTAEDWLSRFNTVCERCSGSDCDHRLFKDEEVCDCFARWLQMPYEEGGAK